MSYEFMYAYSRLHLERLDFVVITSILNSHLPHKLTIQILYHNKISNLCSL